MDKNDMRYPVDESLRRMTELIEELADKTKAIGDALNILIGRVDNLEEDVAIMQTNNPTRAIDELKEGVAKHTDIARWQLDETNSENSQEEAVGE